MQMHITLELKQIRFDEINANRMKADILDGVATSAQYADLAEKFTADHKHQRNSFNVWRSQKK